MNDLQMAAAVSLLLHEVPFEDEANVILPTKLAAHLCVDTFDFYAFLRREGIMTRVAGVRGSSPHEPSSDSIEFGWMVSVRRPGKDTQQPLFTESGCEEICRRLLKRPTVSIYRAIRVASVFLMLGKEATTAVPKSDIHPVGTRVILQKGEGIWTIDGFDYEDYTYTASSSLGYDGVFKGEDIKEVLKPYTSS